ncbi:hypothetical protein LQ327_09715 [Actinomycetospora endophytica]|uniref:Excreted virulence factor EspC (Type VII ESX diderm) n=1 Tax=Actinomycetospora endophytica TaxID=2291215 RepID=A0ABS8P5Z7_9PSEU|nr:hypothetical protein [Actinomycetospora endophytica]MCD2193656.1 hypothetical protein [Actinomycetospora endophytica]
MSEPTTLASAEGPTPVEQLSAITRRGNATWNQAREQWTGQVKELGAEARTRAGYARENPEQVLDAVFDLVIRLIDQQREFTRGLLRATAQIRRSAAAGIQDSAKAVDLEAHHATSSARRRAS